MLGGGLTGGGSHGGPAWPRAGMGGAKKRPGGLSRMSMGMGGGPDGGAKSEFMSLGLNGRGGGLSESRSRSSPCPSTSIGGSGGAGGRLCHGLSGGVSCLSHVSSSNESTLGGGMGGGCDCDCACD